MISFFFYPQSTGSVQIILRNLLNVHKNKKDIKNCKLAKCKSRCFSIELIILLGLKSTH